jgi:hypothetical protein
MRLAQFATGGAGVLAVLVLPGAGMMASCSQAAVPAAAVRPAPASPTAPPAPAVPVGSFRPGQLSGVAATSARSAWAVGVTNRNKPLVEHWDGRTWNKVRSPDPGLSGGFVPLQGVAALSARSAWAVGAVRGHTLILYWNGSAWQQVRSPSPSNQGDALAAVAAMSASSAWAVGSAGSSRILSTTLIEHWNGRTWKHVPSPAPEPGCGGCRFPGDTLLGVAATSVRSAWAVGSTGRGALIERWDGTRWRWVRGPAAALAGGILNGVAALSATGAWAVGTADGEGKTLIEHWNGRTWIRVPSPSPARPVAGNVLTSVAATSADNAWAAGYSGNKTLILHWNGKTWTQVPAPSPGDEPEFLGVAAASAHSAWAVGLSGSDHTLIVHWNGKTWTRQADRHRS